MKTTIRRILFILGMTLSWQTAAQKRCATQDMLQRLTPEQRRHFPGGDLFEAQLQMTRAARTANSLCDSGTVFYIPVVFHIIHNGEPLGQGANIPDARMLEQIRILNEDYRRKQGTPGFNTDPRGKDAMIEFYLAQRDPQGNATSGIVRVNGGRDVWTLGDNDTFKNLSIWPTNQYLNVWVCSLQGYLGYASFPQTSLPLGGQPVYSRPDGVVAGYKYVGNSTTSRLYAGGRTLTHEIGHFFGLIHIWGDGDCGATDYCDDTPPQAGELSRCPLIPTDTANLHCPGQPAIMYRNYMGYVYDSCMNIFTRDQVYRMRYVLCNTPARDSLKRQGYTPVKPTAPRLLTIAPNPTTTGKVTLQFNDSGPCTLEIISVDGRLVRSLETDAQVGSPAVLDLAQLPAGLYGLFITLNGRRELTRLLIQQHSQF